MRRFSLLELMTSLAVLSILAAIALPQVYTMQLRARHAERPVNVEGIKDALLAYDVASDWDYISQTHTASAIPTVPLKQPQPWSTGTGDAWEYLDWRPDGDVYCSYGWHTRTDPELVVSVRCDVDGDGDRYWEIHHSHPQSIDPTWFVENGMHYCTSPFRMGGDCW